jgi:hypothetical protein
MASRGRRSSLYPWLSWLTTLPVPFRGARQETMVFDDIAPNIRMGLACREPEAHTNDQAEITSESFAK